MTLMGTIINICSAICTLFFDLCQICMFLVILPFDDFTEYFDRCRCRLNPNNPHPTSVISGLLPIADENRYLLHTQIYKSRHLLCK